MNQFTYEVLLQNYNSVGLTSNVLRIANIPVCTKHGTMSTQNPISRNNPSDELSKHVNLYEESVKELELQRRQEELERKAEELARREAELRAGSAGRRNNWPPLPAFCPVQPCFYQDINVDIPLEFQRIVRHLYHLWMFHAMVLALNIIGAMSLLIADKNYTIFGLSILYFVLLTPFSFICWYRPIYKAFRSDSSFNFMVFFFIFLFQIIITTVQAIGINGGGSCGLMTSISAFGVNAGVGVITLLVTIGFITSVVADVMLMAKVHRIYRSTGASLAKAQAEFTTEIFRNQHVQTAASSAAAAAVNAQIASATAGTNRY